jgi:aryl-alcohol dehydrogenase-like predicted oxidoreductase
LATTPDHDEEAWERRSQERNWLIVDTVDQIAEQRQKSHAQIALAWLLAREEVSSVIIGARTPEQLTDNLGATGWQLQEAELERLNDVSAVPLGYPYRMMNLYGQR